MTSPTSTETQTQRWPMDYEKDDRESELQIDTLKGVADRYQERLKREREQLKPDHDW